MPPGFMNANWLPADWVYACCASPITSPSADSPAALFVFVMSAVIEPTIALAIGAMAVLYLSMSAVSAGSFGTVRTTTTLLTLICGRLVRCPVDRHVDVGHEPAERRCAGHGDGPGGRVGQHAVVGVVGVAADDHVDFVVELGDDAGRSRPTCRRRC